MVQSNGNFDGVKPSCPHCGCDDSLIINSRPHQGHIYRTRVCKKCKLRTFTREVPRDRYRKMIYTIKVLQAEKRELQAQLKGP